MSVLRHCEPVEFEVCERSGQLLWECGLAACENGCATKTVEFVPAVTYQGAVEALRDIATETHAQNSLEGRADDAKRMRKIAVQALGRLGGQ